MSRPIRPPWPKGPKPVHGNLFVPDFVSDLRLLLGQSPDEAVPGESAASRGHALPAAVESLDLGGWLAWALAGLSLFARKPSPSMAEAVATARRVVLGLAMERTGGNITRAAARLLVDRRTIRTYLRRVGLEGRAVPDEQVNDDPAG